MKKNILKPLAVTFFIGGIWDTIAATQYLFFIGTGRLIDKPAADLFYPVFLGSFFICFAFLQFMSSLNIKRYAFNVGCLIIGRLFYVIQLYAWMILVDDFPSIFWFTGIIDGTLVLLYLFFAAKGGLTLRDLFSPQTKGVVGN
jgi:hypothetical protein